MPLPLSLIFQSEMTSPRPVLAAQLSNVLAVGFVVINIVLDGILIGNLSDRHCRGADM